MAAVKGKDERGKWVKGFRPNPGGRPKEPEELKFLKKRVHPDIRIKANKLMMESFNDLHDHIHNEHLSNAHKMLITCLEKSIVDGSIKHMELYFKVMGFNLNMPQTLNIKEEDDSTGLEAIPTDKLEEIQKILESE